MPPASSWSPAAVRHRSHRMASGISRARAALFRVAALCLWTALCPGSPALANCPFCPSLSPTLSEQAATRSVTALASWSSGVRPAGENQGSTTFELLQIGRGKDLGPKAGSSVTLAPFRGGQPGDLFLLWGDGTDVIDWAPPVEFSETAWHYLTQFPAREATTAVRLKYCLRFLEFPDDIIARDAYEELASARYEDIAALQPHLPGSRLLEIVADRTVPEQRLGLYGLLLGLSRAEGAAALLRQRIMQNPEDDAAFGLDGLLGGYLLLTGSDGLDLLEQQFLGEPPTTFARRLALLRAVEFFWTYETSRFARSRLIASVRQLLDDPATAERAVITLARWQDWTIRPRLMQLAFDKGFGTARDRRILRRAIVGYLLAAEQVEPADPELQAAAAQDLQLIRQRDPATWRAATRLLRPQPAEKSP
ncbi:MAG: hypothetical protein KDA79_11995 [Planctomycetaceae bacterium]|nr:hypothetical protein [Planctomycetaceae bacterium]